MNSSLNHRHAQIHAAELQHRAELHRQVAAARAAQRSAGRNTESLLAPPGPIEMVRALLARRPHARVVRP